MEPLSPPMARAAGTRSGLLHFPRRAFGNSGYSHAWLPKRRLRYAIRTLFACAPSEQYVEDRQLFRDGRLQPITDQYMLGRSGSR